MSELDSIAVDKNSAEDEYLKSLAELDKGKSDQSIREYRAECLELERKRVWVVVSLSVDLDISLKSQNMEHSVLETRRVEVFQDPSNQVVIEHFYEKVGAFSRLIGGCYSNEGYHRFANVVSSNCSAIFSFWSC